MSHVEDWYLTIHGEDKPKDELNAKGRTRILGCEELYIFVDQPLMLYYVNFHTSTGEHTLTFNTATHFI